MAQTQSRLLVLVLPLSFAAFVFACGTGSDPIPAPDDDAGGSARSEGPDAGDEVPPSEAGRPDVEVDAGEDADAEAGIACPPPQQRADDCRRDPTDTGCSPTGGRPFKNTCISPDGGVTHVASPKTFKGEPVACGALNASYAEPTYCCGAACVRVRALDCPSCGTDKEFYECSGLSPAEFPSNCTMPPELNPPVTGGRRTLNICCEKKQ